MCSHPEAYCSALSPFSCTAQVSRLHSTLRNPTLPILLASHFTLPKISSFNTILGLILLSLYLSLHSRQLSDLLVIASAPDSAACLARHLLNARTSGFFHTLSDNRCRLNNPEISSPPAPPSALLLASSRTSICLSFLLLLLPSTTQQRQLFCLLQRSLLQSFHCSAQLFERCVARSINDILQF